MSNVSLQKLRRFTFVSLSLISAALCLLAIPNRANADVFTIGNATPGASFFVQGQSFTPSVIGNDGLGTPSGPGGTVLLTSFSIDYVSAPLPFLSIYSFGPTPEQAATGAGSLGIGTHIGGGVYSFNNLELPFSSRLYAVLPQSAVIFDNGGNAYAGGTDMFPQGTIIAESGAGFDIGFNATFATVVPEASTNILALPALLVGMVVRRRQKN